MVNLPETALPTRPALPGRALWRWVRACWAWHTGTRDRKLRLGRRAAERVMEDVAVPWGLGVGEVRDDVQQGQGV